MRCFLDIVISKKERLNMSDLPTTVVGTTELANLVGNMVDCYKETKMKE